MSKIFISYRRADSISATGRIHDRFAEVFGDKRVFKDVEDIPAGEDFRKVLDEAVNNCDYVLVIIGKQWAGIKDADGNLRLHKDGDFVRHEVASALANPTVKTIPILIEGAPPPTSDQLPDDMKDLAYRNMVQVRNDPDFEVDMDRLFRQLDPEGKFYKLPKTGGVSIPMIGGIVAITVVAVIAALLLIPDGNKAAIEEAVDLALDFPEDYDYIDINSEDSRDGSGLAYALWVFEGTGGFVEFYAETEQDAHITVYNSDGEIEADNEDCDDGTVNACVEIDALEGDLYVVVVRNLGFDAIGGEVYLEASTE